jgi:cyclic beta-1,2-glucan synthetase
LRNVGETFARQLGQAILTVAFLPYDAGISLDAVTRTLWRLFFSRRHLLEWQTSSDSECDDKDTLQSFYAAMSCAPLLAVGASALFFFLGHPASWIIFGFLALWLVSPAIAWWISLPIEEKRVEFSGEQIHKLRKLARRTWYFFETFVTADENWLPPDNFQEYPNPVVATRTSPTNIGLALLGTLAAHDFGYVSLRGLTEKISRTLATVEKLERYRGHFYNWYDTRTLKPMQPLYLSTVDNGNLAGLLLTLHTGLLELADQNWNATRIVAGCATRSASGKTSRAIQEPQPVLKRWKNCSRKIQRRRWK